MVRRCPAACRCCLPSLRQRARPSLAPCPVLCNEADRANAAVLEQNLAAAAAAACGGSGVASTPTAGGGREWRAGGFGAPLCELVHEEASRQALGLLPAAPAAVAAALLPLLHVLLASLICCHCCSALPCLSRPFSHAACLAPDPLAACWRGAAWRGGGWI